MKDEADIRVKTTQEFKLKDKLRRHFQAIDLQEKFGFLPEMIIVEKVRGKSNTLVVHAVLTKEEMEKEDARIKEVEAHDKE